MMRTTCTPFGKVWPRLLLAFISLLVLATAQAEVTGVDINQRQPLGAGITFGTSGAYEEITGTVHFAVDPANPRNQVIADIALAPRSAEGKVEFSADLVIWKPLNPALGNGVAIIDIANRGRRVITLFNRPAPGSDFGDAFLMQQGYTIVWVGWEYDVAEGAEIGLAVPSVPNVDNSALSGLGMAAVRDMGSWIKHDSTALVGSDYLLGFGGSQSGRFLRTFLYYGMNSDEAGRKVFDGLMPHIAGASRLDVNRRGATPIGEGSNGATGYPFTDAAVPDPVSGVSEGLLDNPRAQANQPRIIYTDTAVEYWGGSRASALTHTTPDGTSDIALQDNVRRYFLASHQHGPAAFPPGAATTGQQPGNPLDYWWFMRAQLSNLKDWVVADLEPPQSRYPTLAANTLVPLGRLNFPVLPGVQSTSGLNAGLRATTDLSPAGSAPAVPLPLLVPQVSADGNDTGGLQHPELTVPLATYTGWNFTHPQRGDPATLVSITGSYIPFAVTATARTANKDPRLSIAERYTSKDAFLEQVGEAAQALVAERLLLAGDVDDIVQQIRPAQ
jgi:hypothetical protein